MSGWMVSSANAAVAARQAELLRAGRNGHPQAPRPSTGRQRGRGRPAVLRLAGQVLIGAGRWLGGPEPAPGRGRLAGSSS